MNLVPALLATFRRNRLSRRNIALVAQLATLLVLLVVLFAIVFHYLMLAEDQDYPFLTSVYWVLTTMTTLGYGDIVFKSSAGQAFTIIVLVVGIMFIFVLIPFTFIETIYASWVQARNEEMAPRMLSRIVSGHVIITSADPVSFTLIEKLIRYGYSYVLLVPQYEQALPLAEQGYTVMVGELDNPETYRKAHIQIASLVAVTCQRDSVNANVALTVSKLAPTVPVIALAQHDESQKILMLAGASKVLQPLDTLSRSLARRVHGGGQRARIVASYNGLLVAEATVRETSLVGKSISESNLRSEIGVSVLGIWKRGEFFHGTPDCKITERSVLVLSCNADQLNLFNMTYQQGTVSDKPVLIIGGGRVGQATGQALERMKINYRIIERDPEEGSRNPRMVVGDASRLNVLREAGIDDTPTVILTTHDDDINIYLTLYLRSIRPDMTIISRSMHERNLNNLHRAGADFVMSHASMGANAIFNALKRTNIEMLAEGLDIFRIPVPKSLAGKSLAEIDLRRRTGCILVAITGEDGMHVNPDASTPLPASVEIILLATVEDEARFLKAYPR